MNIIFYIADALFLLIAGFMFYFTYILARYTSSSTDSPARPKIWSLLLALLIVPFSLWLSVIAWQQPWTVMSGAKGAAHGWVVGVLSLSCASLFAWLAYNQMKVMLKRQ